MPKSSLFKNYVSPKGEERIRNYKYKCQTDSLIYTYIMGPMANFAVKYMPLTMAPNTITFIGFVFNLIPHIIILSYNGEDLSTPLPQWLCLLTGICQFLYMHFDNMDGKQARRTNSSSSLGMLYDHGLDAVSGWIMALNFASVVRIGNGLFPYVILTWAPLLGFYFTMWEEYYLNFLNFGMVNPVDEGLSSMNMLIIFTGFVGSEWWLGEAVFGINRSYFVAGLTLGACCFGMILNIVRVTQKYKGQAQETLNKLKVTFYLMTCVFIISFCSPSGIVDRRTRSLVTCFGLGFSKVIGHIQLAHCAGDEFFQWRRSFLLSSFILVANTLAGFVSGKCPINEDLLLNVAIVFNLLGFIHYMLSITQQLTRVLDIKVFSIKPKKEA